MSFPSYSLSLPPQTLLFLFYDACPSGISPRLRVPTRTILFHLSPPSIKAVPPFIIVPRPTYTLDTPKRPIRFLFLPFTYPTYRISLFVVCITCRFDVQQSLFSQSFGFSRLVPFEEGRVLLWSYCNLRLPATDTVLYFQCQLLSHKLKPAETGGNSF